MYFILPEKGNDPTVMGWPKQEYDPTVKGRRNYMGSHNILKNAN